RYNGDKFLSNIAVNPWHYKNFTMNKGLITLHDNGSNVCEIVINKAHSMLAHLSGSKTLAYLRDHV
ncbi:hypothetical protein BDN71DRAFT_1394205, partial [Pleurotus eryngii]